jgi:type II secretory pathway component PulM
MNYKQKYQLLLGGIALFLVIAYWLAFGKTWTAYQTTNQLQQQLSSAGQAWQQIEGYQRQLKQLESEQNNQFFTQNYLFQKVTTFCQENKLAIQEMPESMVYEQQDVEILHNPIKVEGTFVPIVQLLYNLEQKQQLGRIVSVEFNLGKNYQSRQTELTASIQLQNIQNKAKKETK